MSDKLKWTLCAWCELFFRSIPRSIRYSRPSGHIQYRQSVTGDEIDVKLTHGICPACIERVRRDPDWKGNA